MVKMANMEAVIKAHDALKSIWDAQAKIEVKTASPHPADSMIGSAMMSNVLNVYIRGYSIADEAMMEAIRVAVKDELERRATAIEKELLELGVEA